MCRSNKTRPNRGIRSDLADMILFMSKEAQFRIKYQSRDENYHELDADLLSQALFGISEMSRLAYRTANPADARPLQVKVHALNAGSFEIVLEHIVGPVAQVVGEVIDFFNRSDVQRITSTVETLFLISQAINFVRLTAGKMYKAEKRGDEVHITINGDVNIFGASAYELGEDSAFRKSVGNSLAPFQDENYTSMEILDTNENSVESIQQDELPIFSEFQEEVILDETVEVIAYVETIQIRENSKLWSFVDELDQKFSAKMEDEDFASLARRVGSPIGADTKLKLQRNTRIVTTKSGKPKTERRIIKVVSYENPGAQEALF